MSNLRAAARAAGARSAPAATPALPSVTIRCTPRGLCFTIHVRCPDLRLRSPKPGSSVSHVMPTGSDFRRATKPVSLRRWDCLRRDTPAPWLPPDCSPLRTSNASVSSCFFAIPCSYRCVRCARSCSPYVHGLIHHHPDRLMTAKALVSRRFSSPNRA